MQNGVKKTWLSKTLWTNFIMAGLVMFWPAAGDIVASHPEVASIAWAGINVLLRLITKDALSISE